MRFVLVVAVIVLLAAGFVFYRINQPYKGFEGERFIDLAKGTPTSRLAKTLEGQGIVRESWMLLAARALNPQAKLQAGEYRFDKAASALDVFRRIARGDVFYMEVTIPEGQNIFDIAANVARLGTFTDVQFLKAAQNASIIRDLDPHAETLEGYLWPDTYRVIRKTTPAQLCLAMTHKFRDTWKGLQTDADVHRTVTLASLIEREARVPGDRPLVATVFKNRLNLGMRLDCDPTTVYAALLEGRYRGKIYRSDLENPNAYNTYQHAGLPPGPIANPGLSSLKAALAPAESKYLYFVAKPDGSGSHIFSENLKAHAAAAADYRRGQNR